MLTLRNGACLQNRLVCQRDLRHLSSDLKLIAKFLFWPMAYAAWHSPLCWMFSQKPLFFEMRMEISRS